jgi:hypothetical protein
MRISQRHRDVFMVHQFFHRGKSTPAITRRLAKVCRKSCVKFSSPALRTASSNAERKERLGSTVVAAEDRLSASVFILTAFSVVVNTSFMGTSSSHFGDQLVSTRDSSSRPRIMSSSPCSQRSQTLSRLTAWGAWQNVWRQVWLVHGVRPLNPIAGLWRVMQRRALLWAIVRSFPNAPATCSWRL